MLAKSKKTTTLYQRIVKDAMRQNLREKLIIALVAAAVVCSVSTYIVITHLPMFGGDPTAVMVLFYLDLFILVMLGSVVANGLYHAWRNRHSKLAGSRLQIRMISVFALLTAAPAMFVAMFAAAFFYFGVESWFSAQIRTSLSESLEVAKAYLEEHKQVLRADAMAMANDLNRQSVFLERDPARFNDAVSAQAYLRNLPEIIVFDGSGKILARSGLTFALTFEPITDEMRQQARDGDVALIVSENDDRVRALVQLDGFNDTYLFVGRMVEPKVLAHMAATQTAVDKYNRLEENRFEIQLIIGAIFAVVSLLLLLAAVWFGLKFAVRLTKPIGDLIWATDRVRHGDLRARVKETRNDTDDEIELLGRAFNRMTSQLDEQRSKLMDANYQLDFRRRFTEAVLYGVSSGVIGLDSKCRIILMNVAAAEFFRIHDAKFYEGMALSALAPEIEKVIEKAVESTVISEQVEIKRHGYPSRTILVRVASEEELNEAADYEEDAPGSKHGFVVTFDDVSDLLSAQRKAAWADIAKRIAHEIKNPLTPIQLSAERLKRKYMKEIATEPEVFETCTDTIIRHVEDIGRMVDEFSAFARMPSPVIKRHEIREIARQALFLQSSSRSDIIYEHDMPPEPFFVDFDARQMSQALTNLLKNAAEAIDMRLHPEGERSVVITENEEEEDPFWATERMRKRSNSASSRGRIWVKIYSKGKDVIVTVEDNGKGLPVEERNNLTEPYVTTRKKGTGLGLAIVKKIMEDHLGRIELEDRLGGGAKIKLIWPIEHVNKQKPFEEST
ncbi:MAG: PAS domain-containing sensor histidine kinase [Alphaproteobacteria bacterium]|nr:PAS domain-containing sensor histidine kinase [Alphaproteobacteria bacterium]MCL2504660.1 PAS domain-containing sensor histidine kinase [Alphaproteobacteria bacterium]